VKEFQNTEILALLILNMKYEMQISKNNGTDRVGAQGRAPLQIIKRLQKP
jgi:hypothetical protein